MKKLLASILFLILVPFVCAVNDISVNPVSDSIIADAGEQITETIILSNSNSTDSWLVTLPSSLNFIGLGHTLSSVPVLYNVSGSSILINLSSSETIDYTFTVPSDAYAESYNEVLNFTTASEEDFASLSIALAVNADHNITAGNIDSWEIAQGQTETAALTLVNRGNIDETAALTASIDLTSTTNPANKITASISPGSLKVDYKKTNSTTLTINVPSNAAKETYSGNIPITYSGKTLSPSITVNVVDPAYSINAGNIAFPLSEPNATVSTSFVVKNTGNAALTNIVLSSRVDSKYALSFSQTTPFNLGIDEEKPITATVIVPYNEKIGTHSIGFVDVLSSQKNFTSAYNVYVNPEEKLDFDDLDIFIDGDQESNVENGKKIGETAKPGSEIELKIKLKNTFSIDSEIEIRDITLTVTITDEDGDDVDSADADVGDLDADEKSAEESVSFILPLDVQEGKHTIEIEAEGDDEKGITHRVIWKVYYELEKRSHDVIIHKTYLTPESVRCARNTVLSIKIMNIGSKTEDKVRLQATNSDLGINFNKQDIELNRDPDSSENTYTQEILIDAKGKAAGAYPILIKAYYDTDLLDDIKTANLVIEDCIEQRKNDTTTVVVQQQQPPQQQRGEITLPVEAGEEEVPETTEVSFTQSTGGIVLLLTGSVAVLVVVIGLAAKLFFVPKIKP